MSPVPLTYFRNRLRSCFLLFLFLPGLGILLHAQPKPAAGGASGKKHLVFLVSKDSLNYEADTAIPPFAGTLSEKHGYKTTVLQAEGERTRAHFPGLEILRNADLVVVFARRLALSQAQLDLLKNYVKSGKPLVGIRTANHAFSVTEKTIPAGYADWWEFVPDVLGCYNRGYGPVAEGTEVSATALSHPILKNVTPVPWHSTGNLYYVEMAGRKQVEVLLEGAAAGKKNPIAWTAQNSKSRIFYTSLGHPADWKTPQFPTLLLNAISWCLNP